MSLSLLIVSILLQGPTGRPYSEERQLLDRHLAQLARPLPDAPVLEEDAALLKQTAVEAGLRDIEIGPPTITETANLGQSRRTVLATSTYPDADRFFRALQGSPRLVDVENLVLRSADFGVRIEARVRLYHRPRRTAILASLDPARTRDRTRGATREDAARFSRDEQLVLEKTITLDELRRRHNSPRMFLAETGASFRDAAAALTFGSLDGDTGRFTLRGVVAGMGAADALERRLEGGFFRLREFSRAQKGGCFEFEVVGESFRAGPDAALPLPVEEPFRPTEPFCFQNRDGGITGTVGATLRATGSESGVTLRATDTDLADIAAMIEALTREPFVVAGDLRGRVNVDFNNASIDDAVKVLPVHTEQVGRVRLLRSVSAALTPVPAPEDLPAGGPLTLRGKRARGEDILSAIAEAEPSYAALGPGNLEALSVFAREVPLADVRRAALSALGLVETREDNVRVLKHPERASEAGPIAAANNARIVFRARDLSVEEMVLAGIGRSANDLVAFVYSPLGELVTLRVGDTLADGVLALIDTNGVLVDTSEGPVRISLATPRPR